MPSNTLRADILEQIARRVGQDHAERRLNAEAGGEHPVFGQGRTFFHIENLVFSDALIRGVLKVLFLHKRGQRNALNIAVTGNDVPIAGLPAAFDGYRILQLSDLHLDMNDALADRIIDTVAPLSFDMCVITGDFRYRTYGPWDKTMEALRKIRPVLGDQVFGVLGNHDSIRMVSQIEAESVQLLMNESVPIRKEGAEFWLVGVDDPHFFCTDDIGRARRDVPEGAPSILLAHSPEIFQSAAAADFRLMLCGHTHGGQIRLPGGIPIIVNAKCPREYCSGAWQHESMLGYTSKGTGSSIVDIRFNCRPEVTLHTLMPG